MRRGTPVVSPVLTHAARWSGRFASGQVSKRGDGRRWGEMKGRTRVTSFTWE